MGYSLDPTVSLESLRKSEISYPTVMETRFLGCPASGKNQTVAKFCISFYNVLILSEKHNLLFSTVNLPRIFALDRWATTVR